MPLLTGSGTQKFFLESYGLFWYCKMRVFVAVDCARVFLFSYCVQANLKDLFARVPQVLPAGILFAFVKHR